ncbi:MAG: AAA family ATPase, partial [Syntrophomonadaceae bacterium]|nr:AAA family ATPase [Syntrophomonadaceae bacterium]
PALGFEDIGGQETAIRELKEALDFMVQADHIARMGIRPLKGILLVGPPGTGKTLMARAAAGFTGSAFISAAGSDFIEVYAGMGARRIRKLFQDARQQAKAQKLHSAIIFIDELDILGARRGSNSGHMEYDQTLNQLLVEMDGIAPDVEPRLLIMAATNRPDILDSALLRPGRFDRQVQVDLPDRRGRESILKLHSRNKPLAEDVDLPEIARASFGFSGAHLESLTNEAAILAMRDGVGVIDQRHMNEALDKVLMGEKLERQLEPEELIRVSCHEAGHALVSELTEPGSVTAVSIIPRGRALGFMRKAPARDKYLHTLAEFEQQIKVALAGAVAEEMCLGCRSSGAVNDYDQAWQLAENIIKAGLSSLGIVNTEQLPVEVRFEESRSIITRLEEDTRALLLTAQQTLNRLAEQLRYDETLSREELETVFKFSYPSPVAGCGMAAQ